MGVAQKVSDPRNKNSSVNVRIDDRTRSKLDRLARRQNVRLSDYIRLLLRQAVGEK